MTCHFTLYAHIDVQFQLPSGLRHETPVLPRLYMLCYILKGGYSRTAIGLQEATA